MDKIQWCLNVSSGIEFIDPNSDLSKIYFKKAEDVLLAMKKLKGNTDWEITSAYYAQYFSVYALFQKIGLKSEIHSCTLELMKIYLKNYFSLDELNLIIKSQKSRIDLQYYSQRNISEKLHLEILKNTPLFLIKSKEIATLLNEREIKLIRGRIQNDTKRNK